MSAIEILSAIAQYGIAGVALYMLYSICNNHLKQIETTLGEIKGLLEANLKK